MSGEQDKHASDEELLASAIPIDDLADEDQIEDEPSTAAEAGPALSDTEDDPELIELVEEDETREKHKITKYGEGRQRKSEWRRAVNTTGQGATHMRTFHAKLRPDGIELIDQMINEWLDENPDYEVKFANVTAAVLMSKISEPTLFVTVWV